AGLPTGGGAHFAHFKASGTTGFAGRIYATTNGAPSGFYRVGIANTDNDVPSVIISSNLSPNTDYVLVQPLVHSNAVSILWTTPAAETDPGATAADTPVTVTVATFALRESLSSTNGMGSLYVDNLVVGTSFADVANSNAPVITTQPQ